MTSAVLLAFLALLLGTFVQKVVTFAAPKHFPFTRNRRLHSSSSIAESPYGPLSPPTALHGWVESNGEWVWKDDDGTVLDSAFGAISPATSSSVPTETTSITPPKLPKGSFRPKQSLGQNFLTDSNTIERICSAFESDASAANPDGLRAIGLVELGPGPGALTQVLLRDHGAESLLCVEIDPRSVELLRSRHPGLSVIHSDVLQISYPALRATLCGPEGPGLAVVGNLPYYITSQILFALADASHEEAVRSATVTMQVRGGAGGGGGEGQAPQQE